MSKSNFCKPLAAIKEKFQRSMPKRNIQPLTLFESVDRNQTVNGDNSVPEGTTTGELISRGTGILFLTPFHRGGNFLVVCTEKSATDKLEDSRSVMFIGKDGY